MSLFLNWVLSQVSYFSSFTAHFKTKWKCQHINSYHVFLVTGVGLQQNLLLDISFLVSWHTLWMGRYLNISLQFKNISDYYNLSMVITDYCFLQGRGGGFMYLVKNIFLWLCFARYFIDSKNNLLQLARGNLNQELSFTF